VITIRDVGPTRDTFPLTPGHSAIGRITVLALAADGARMYAGSFAGVWRSEDGGRNWRQLTWPAPPAGENQAEIPGALYAPHIFDMAASPTDVNLVLVSALASPFLDGRNGIYRTTDGGANWVLVQGASVGCNIVFAPDDSQLVFAAIGSGVIRSRNGGVDWDFVSFFTAWHVAVGPLEPDGTRRVYAAGDSRISYSPDGGDNWFSDAGAATIIDARNELDLMRVGCDPNNGSIGGFAKQIQIENTNGTAGRVLAIEPGNTTRVYLAGEGAANGPRLYSPTVPDGDLCNSDSDCAALAGEGSLWVGDFSQFTPTSPTAQWTQLPGPPVYFGITSPSGVVFVMAKATSTGFLLFFSDASHVHVSSGTPTKTSWHRLDGEDASAAKQAGHHGNIVFVHPDPHGMAFTPDFEIALTPATGVDPPFNQNSVLDQYVGGTLWMANDGGVNWCEDGGRDAKSWQWPLGLETLDPVNIAGLFGLGNTPALYFGSGDNNDFFTRDGGAHWGDPGSNCGDCDAWFADVAQADRVIQFLPRRPPDDTGPTGYIGVVRSGDSSQYPDASPQGSKIFIPSTRAISFDPIKHLAPYASSGLVLRGYRPIIKTLATEAPLPDGDYVFMDQNLDTGVRTLLRTTSISAIAELSDWADPTKAAAIGPAVPGSADIVQVSGGHFAPVYYVGDASGNVSKLSADKTTWSQIVPHDVVIGTSVQNALSWFVDPYDPDGVFVLDADGVKISTDGGESWFFDPALTNAVTGGGKLTISASLLQDMQFSRGERQTRFAMGTAGVFCTMDFGITWFPVLNSIALPGRPESGFFDPLSDQTDRAFYVECEGRSILRIGGLPDLPPFQPPPTFDLLEFAALDL
jgi:hypothetical protein